MDKSAGDASPLKALVVEATAAVADMKDPELKRVAFEKIMESLLARQETERRPVCAAPPKGIGRPKKNAVATGSKGPKGYVLGLVDEGFFKKPQTMADIMKALDERGHHLRGSDLTKPLQFCARNSVLRRRKEQVGKKKIWRYSNW